MGKSKTFEILKQGGVWGALEHIIDKKAHKGGIYALLQRLMMAQILRKLDSAHSNEMILFCKKHHIYTTNPTFLKYFAKEYDNIKLWLASQSFLEKYANHPYPPLLNPNTLDYEQISPQIAWELNIPLPPYYKFIYFGSHASGNRGLNHFVLNCGGMDYIRYPSSSKIIYEKYWEQILSYHYTMPPPHFGYLSSREYMKDKDSNKLYALIPQTKALNLIRDPISILKSGINFRRKRLQMAQEENLSFALSPDFICENLIGYNGYDAHNDESTFGKEDAPCFGTIRGSLKYNFTDFHDTDLRKALINIADEDIICIDMSEIVGKRAFETMNTLAKAFSFPAPKPSDKEKFEVNVSYYEGLLPLVFRVQMEQKSIALHLIDKIFALDERIYVKVPVDEVDIWQHKNTFEHYQDITQFLFNQDNFYERIIVCIEKKDFEILKQDTKTCEQIKEYLLAFIPRLEEQRKIEESKKLSEEQILQYLHTHKELALQAKAVFEKHLTFLASVRPDIIESWKYYQEFLAMCEEMS